VLSISGLHMSLLAAFVFAALRSGIALVPVVALRVSSKKIAAAVALVAAAFYFGLSGGAVATQRSFVMIAVMLVAVLVNRRAISLRSIAIAALIVLVLQPESLLQPGFQMSFAATVALVAAFSAGRDLPEGHWQMPRWLRPVAALALASAVAGTATAPYGAAAFNKVSGYGLLANMLAEPVMALLVMPGAVIAAALSLVGLADPVLWLMVQGARWILYVSDLVAGLQGAVVGVVAPQPYVLPLLTLGGLWLVLVPLHIRWAGGGVVLMALVAWSVAERPALLVSGDAAIVGVMTNQGRAFSTMKGGKFIVTNWMEDDGDLTPLKEAGRRDGFDLTEQGLAFAIGTKRGLVVAGETGANRLAELCLGTDLLIISPRKDKLAVPLPEPGPCQRIDPDSLRLSGPLALSLSGNGWVTNSVAEVQGQRLWTGKPPPPPRADPTAAQLAASASLP
jgi:competence protein ComEC